MTQRALPFVMPRSWPGFRVANVVVVVSQSHSMMLQRICCLRHSRVHGSLPRLAIRFRPTKRLANMPCSRVAETVVNRA